MQPEIPLVASAALCGVSVILLTDASLKNKEAETKLQNLTRLQLITAVYLEENKFNWRKIEMKKVRIFSKVSNSTLIIGGAGVALLAAAIVKGCTWDQRDTELPHTDVSMDVIGDGVTDVVSDVIEEAATAVTE